MVAVERRPSFFSEGEEVGEGDESIGEPFSAGVGVGAMVGGEEEERNALLLLMFY